jgi:VWFA-related protein
MGGRTKACLFAGVVGLPIISVAVISAGAASVASSQVQVPLRHEVTVVNIAVPTRVFNGDKFVDNLTADDFVVLENGVSQKVEAAYLIRKTNVLQNAMVVGSTAPVSVPVERPDESLKRRHFVLIFEMDEYLAQMTKAIDIFFSETMSSQDTVRVVTPSASWDIPSRTLDSASRTAIAEDVKSRVRKSLTMSGARLKSLIRDLRFNDSAGKTDYMGARPIGEEADYMKARAIINEFVLLKDMNIGSYKRFASYLKPLTGQKYAFIFYQKESYVIPVQYKSIFEGEAKYARDIIHREDIQKTFADAGTTVHFLYMTQTSGSINDVEFRNANDAAPVEMSGDFYSAFRDLADATGGISEATANPIYAFRRAVEASENYYVVYYKPVEYKADGKYKEITVKVKGGRYRVTHRAGYIDK